jgi:small subunit ribosomal protein S24e
LAGQDIFHGCGKFNYRKKNKCGFEGRIRYQGKVRFELNDFLYYEVNKMDIEVLKKSNEPLMHRTHYEAKLIFEGKTPSRTDIIKNLCQKLSSKENMTIIRKITTDYGSERAMLNGFIYDNEKTMDTLERKFVKLRHLSKADQKAEKEKTKATKQATAPVKGAKKK